MMMEIEAGPKSPQKSSQSPVEDEKAAEISSIKYQLENLSVVDTDVEGGAIGGEISFTPAQAVLAAVVEEALDLSEELQMIGSALPDPVVEPGEELIHELEAIPDKMAFKIGEAAEMVGVKQYVLRYWESEFEMLRPRKSKNNQRVYSRRDVETAMMIKKLLYEDRFSIEGARAALRQLKSQVKEDRGIKRMVETHESALSSAIHQLRGIAADLGRLRAQVAASS